MNDGVHESFSWCASYSYIPRSRWSSCWICDHGAVQARDRIVRGPGITSWLPEDAMVGPLAADGITAIGVDVGLESRRPAYSRKLEPQATSQRQPRCRLPGARWPGSAQQARVTADHSDVQGTTLFLPQFFSLRSFPRPKPLHCVLAKQKN